MISIFCIWIYFSNEDRLITKENLQNDKLGESNKMGEYVQNWPKTGVDPNIFCAERVSFT